MLPAEQAPVVAASYVLTALLGAGALARLVDNVHRPRERTEAVAWLVVDVFVLVVAIVAVALTRSSETTELAKTRAPRSCQAQRNATIMAEMLVVANVWSVAAMTGAVAWAPKHVTVVRDALTMTASLGALVTVWYFASTIEYAPLPRMPEPSEAYEEAATRREFIEFVAH